MAYHKKRNFVLLFSPSHYQNLLDWERYNVTSLPRSSLSQTCHTTTPERKVGWSSGQRTEKLLWNFKGPLEATVGKQGLEVRAPARPLFLFSHSRSDHTQRLASCLNVYILRYLTTTCPQRSSTSSVLEVKPKESQTVRNKKQQ